MWKAIEAWLSRGNNAVMVVLPILGIGAAIAMTGQGDAPAPPAVPPAGLVELTAEDLRAAWAGNEARAERDYGAAWFAVRGTVASVSVNLSNNPVVHLLTDEPGVPLTIHLIDRDKPQAIDLMPGDVVGFACQRSTQMLGLVSALDCSFRSAADQ